MIIIRVRLNVRFFQPSLRTEFDPSGEVGEHPKWVTGQMAWMVEEDLSSPQFSKD